MVHYVSAISLVLDGSKALSLQCKQWVWLGASRGKRAPIHRRNVLEEISAEINSRIFRYDSPYINQKETLP
jgi:hypothetical protein